MKKKHFLNFFLTFFCIFKVFLTFSRVTKFQDLHLKIYFIFAIDKTVARIYCPISNCYKISHFKKNECEPDKMVKQTHKICLLLPRNCSSVFEHFVGLALNQLNQNFMENFMKTIFRPNFQTYSNFVLLILCKSVFHFFDTFHFCSFFSMC